MFIELFFNFISAVICIIILKVYFGIFFELNEQRASKNFLWWLFLFWQVGGVSYSGIPLYAKLLISVMLIVIISTNIYKGDLLFKIIVSILICTIWTLFEYLIGSLFIFAGLDFHILKISGAAISEGLTLALIVILKRYFKNKIMCSLPVYYYILIMLVPVGGIYLIYNLFYLSSIIKSNQAILISIVGFFIILVINIVIFKIYLLLGKKNELEKENISYAQQLVSFEKYYGDREQLNDNFRKARHDFKQHCSILYELIKKEEYIQVQKYLDNMIADNIVHDSFIIKTDNVVVDSIVNSKLSAITREDIELITDIHVPIQLPYELADIGLLLGNIIDNAVEAIARDENVKKFIKLFIKYEAGMLLVTCINTFSGLLNKNNKGEILTDKCDTYYHGFGLSSIRKIADKYHGAVIIEDYESIFKIKVMIYSDNGK